MGALDDFKVTKIEPNVWFEDELPADEGAVDGRKRGDHFVIRNLEGPAAKLHVERQAKTVQIKAVVDQVLDEVGGFAADQNPVEAAGFGLGETIGFLEDAEIVLGGVIQADFALKALFPWARGVLKRV